MKSASLRDNLYKTGIVEIPDLIWERFHLRGRDHQARSYREMINFFFFLPEKDCEIDEIT